MSDQSEFSIKRNLRVDPKLLDDICDDLRGILIAELNAGNYVLETWQGTWPRPEGSFSVFLGSYFLREHQVPEGVEYDQVNDPHFAGAEYWCPKHRHSLFCAFSSWKENKRPIGFQP